MAALIALREDTNGPALRKLVKATKDAAQARRLLALAEIYDASSRTDAARIGGVTLQIVRDWVLRFNAHGPDGLSNRKALGNRPKLNEDQRQALARMVESGPIPAIHGVVRWRRKDLARWLLEEFRIEVDETTVGRSLRALGFAKLSARPHHYAQNEVEMEAFKKTCLPNWGRSGQGCRTALR
jgi:transposase